MDTEGTGKLKMKTVLFNCIYRTNHRVGNPIRLFDAQWVPEELDLGMVDNKLWGGWTFNENSFFIQDFPT